ncbi:KRAB-A domain-containing protein 2-like [Palaemon carinicauda]|uniref:KRAB-A domain-containing protein 2-like n=1 Tax=Palaemon carinicauda TaxID=392227 RepID=UPI0035B696F2
MDMSRGMTMKQRGTPQVDLIDMQSQPDGKYRFIFNYQYHLTKVICLRALQTKTAEEVAFHLVDIFCDKGAPHILQSDNGRGLSKKWQKNTRFHSGIGRTPYEAMYGEKAHLGISTVNIPEKIMEGMETEEQLVEALCLVNEEDQNVEQGGEVLKAVP